jgi:hypothetical protein
MPAIFHSDGDTRAIYPALARAGFSAVHPGGAEGEGLAHSLEAAKAVGMTVLGGLPARSLIARGAGGPGAEAGELAAGGGLIVCDDGGIATPMEAASLAAAHEVARRVWSAE